MTPTPQGIRGWFNPIINTFCNILEHFSIANKFNNHFRNVGFNLTKNISLSAKDASIYDYLGEGCK